MRKQEKTLVQHGATAARKVIEIAWNCSMVTDAVAEICVEAGDSLAELWKLTALQIQGTKPWVVQTWWKRLYDQNQNELYTNNPTTAKYGRTVYILYHCDTTVFHTLSMRLQKCVAMMAVAIWIWHAETQRRKGSVSWINCVILGKSASWQGWHAAKNQLLHASKNDVFPHVHLVKGVPNWS